MNYYYSSNYTNILGGPSLISTIVTKTADKYNADCGKNCKINLQICQGESCCAISKITSLVRNGTNNFMECKNHGLNPLLPVEISIQNEGTDQWIAEFINVMTNVNHVFYHCPVDEIQFGNQFIKKTCKVERGIHFEIDPILS